MIIADLYIINEIGSEGITASYVQDFLMRNKKAEKINLHIDSGGGSVYEGYAIYNLLRNCGKKIDAHIISYCGSIATMIALSADNIYMNEHGRFMIHNPSTQVQGDVHTVKKAVKELENIKNELINLYHTKTGMDKNLISDLMDDEKSFTAIEAKESRFITTIKEPSKAVAFIETKSNFINMEKKELEGMFSRFFADVKGMLKPKNEGEQILTTGEEVGFDIWVNAMEGEDLEGKEVKKIVAGEVSEEAVEDGSYPLADGSTITIAEGLVGSIGVAEEEGNEEVEALKAQLAEKEALLNDALESLNAFKAESEVKELENNSKVESLAKQVEEIKNLTVGVKDSFINKASNKINNEDKFFKLK
jgi:ATP-dependent protease ClpP protease subunit